MAWDQTFDEEIADFDAISPAWDKHATGLDADWTSETDADNDLNEAAGAAHDGAKGYELTYDDANAAFGVLTAGAADQTTGVVCLWFAPNGFTLTDTNQINLVYAYDGASAPTWGLQLQMTGTDYQIRPIYYNDAAGFNGGTFQTISDAYHHLLIMFSRSTGAGNDDGWVKFYIDGVLQQNWTGHDNDTRDWDQANFGVVYASQSSGFGGSFYFDECYIDPVGAPMVNTLALQVGTYGMMVPISETTARYGEFTDPVADTFATVDLQFDPNLITMAANDQFTIVKCDGEFTIEFKYTGSAYQVQLALTTDGGTDATSWYTITDEYHHIRAIWSAATGVGENDGYAKLFIDDVLQEQILGLDTDTLSTDEVQFGAVTGLDAGTYGIIYMDNCQWNDALTQSAQAGAFVSTGTAIKKPKKPVAGPFVSTGAVTKKGKKPVAGIVTFAGNLVGKAKKALAGALVLAGVLTKFKLWIFFARFHDYFLTAPQRFTISSNKVQMTARYKDYYLTAPEKK